MAELTIRLTLPNAAGAFSASCRDDEPVATVMESFVRRFRLPPDLYRLRVIRGDVAEDLDPSISLRGQGISHGASLWLDGGAFIQAARPVFTGKIRKPRLASGLGDRHLHEPVEVDVAQLRRVLAAVNERVDPSKRTILGDLKFASARLSVLGDAGEGAAQERLDPRRPPGRGGGGGGANGGGAGNGGDDVHDAGGEDEPPRRKKKRRARRTAVPAEIPAPAVSVEDVLRQIEELRTLVVNRERSDERGLVHIDYPEIELTYVVKETQLWVDHGARDVQRFQNIGYLWIAAAIGIACNWLTAQPGQISVASMVGLLMALISGGTSLVFASQAQRRLDDHPKQGPQKKQVPKKKRPSPRKREKPAETP
jgi:hypothetical protein